MQILLSGLSEQACLAYLGTDTALPAQLCWHSADGFIAAAEAASPKKDERLWVWLYRAPWELLFRAGQGEVATVLAQWQVEQRAVLGLRRVLGQKLLLVNADRVSPALLCARLELTWQQNPALPGPSGLTPAIAGLFERMAPQYWDLYEMLEATAWLPEGEPQFRHDLPAPSLDGLLPLLQILQNGLTLPALQTALTQAEQQHHYLEQALEESRRLSDKAEAERQSLAEENDLLLAQLHQVQEELEKHYLDSKAQATVLANTRQQLEQELEEAKQATAKLDGEHKSQVGKNQLLQTMLQQVQEDLKKQQAQAASSDKNHAAALKQQEQKLAESGKQLQQASDKLKKLEQELEKSRQAVTQAEGDRQSLAEENDLLLAQLHQVQEELESYYLANRELQAVMGQSQQTLHRARAVVSRLVCNA